MYLNISKVGRGKDRPQHIFGTKSQEQASPSSWKIILWLLGYPLVIAAYQLIAPHSQFEFNDTSVKVMRDDKYFLWFKEINKFKFSDSDFKDFKNYLKKNKFSFETKNEKALNSAF